MHGPLVFLGALVVYLLLGQETLYGDGPGVLLAMHDGKALSGSTHFLYGPILLGVWRATEPLGLTLFEASTLCSALGTALGVLFLYYASRCMGAAKGAAVVVAALAGACPSIVFFATVVELHGAFFTFVGLATWQLARLVRQPGFARATALGLSTAVAAMSHATGHLLPFLLAMFFVALLWQPRRLEANARRERRTLGLAAWVVAAHGLTFILAWIVMRMAGLGGGAPDVAAGVLVTESSKLAVQLEALPETFWHGWLLPYLPVSVIAVAGLMIPAQRPPTIAFCIGVVVYVLLAVVLAPGGGEFGAYAAPLAWPAAWLCIQILPSRLAGVLVPASLVLAGVHVWLHDHPAASDSFVAGVREVTAGRPAFLLVTTNNDVEACFTRLGCDFLYLPPLLMNDADTVRSYLPQFDDELSGQFARQARVLMTQTARDMLGSEAALEHSTGPAALLQHLETNYRVSRVRAQGFRGWVVEPKK